jgi:predicted RNA-binding Zn ribbon-like protein
MTGENDMRAGPQPGGRPPAPGELALVQAFVNSNHDLASPGGGETFLTTEGLRDWLGERGLLGSRQRISGQDLDRALAVREGLRALAFANNDQDLDVDAIDAMRRASQGATSTIRIEPEGPVFAPDTAAGMDAAIGHLLAITARAMIDGTWRRVKACPGRHCGWVFYDQSRNQSARWCSMTVCGDREKARAYYQRKTANVTPGSAGPNDRVGTA